MSDPFIGEIRMVAFTYAPRGWAYCLGQQMSIAQNSALFALLGTVYGGNGVSTFGLPDLRGRSPVGTGTGPGLSAIDLGELSGVENVTLLSTNMPMHNHPATATVTATATAEQAVGTVASNPVAIPSATNKFLAASGTGQGSATIWSDALSTPQTIGNPPTVNLNVGVGVTVGAAGNSLPFSIRNPYLGMNFVIALVGEFPSRN
ncbi:phage tail protein [Pseudomonas sp. zfem005]|uniref:phage tail protein n=1 Tax=Pseudomonas sp. zfem005 TaxID=3078200 RepID=UPI0029275499|nr:tail fiber protein [Pseudomonas sp. zfem005]MDU9414093.1 tail fiber protein [Pseudomonas sp. zfem005]